MAPASSLALGARSPFVPAMVAVNTRIKLNKNWGVFFRFDWHVSKVGTAFGGIVTGVFSVQNNQGNKVSLIR